ncbi:MAG: HD domain-containing protein [Proteobacteria bacterium]|nr:HD domain-containing protein [Pseudomonadota bacterium]
MDPHYLKKRLDKKERNFLSSLAALSARAQRFKPDHAEERGYRLAFSVDTDRILNSHAYTRYIDKTQVFSLIRNDHITHRVLHVQLVSKIARTIGRALDLNEDLIEAVALGHDIGHTPFGHDGERYLSDLCIQSGIGEFHHNVQSVHFLNRVERNGQGWNLTLESLDGIFCHNGEVHDTCLKPMREKGFSDLEREIEAAVSGINPRPIPMTLEGCVVRMADTISYLGRDIEDAIRLGLLKRSDLPEACTRILGESNGTMVYTMVTDIIANSLGKDAISYSEELSFAIRTLKAFNLERIYKHPGAKQHLSNIKDLFEYLFTRYLRDLEQGFDHSVIVTSFLSHMNPEYRDNMPHAAMVRDFIAGMTDSFFLDQCPDSLKPKTIIF